MLKEFICKGHIRDIKSFLYLDLTTFRGLGPREIMPQIIRLLAYCQKNLIKKSLGTIQGQGH